MKRKILMSALMSAFLMTTACSHKKDDKKKEKAETAAVSTEVTQEGLDKVTKDWPDSSKSAIKSLNQKYGLPNAVTEDMVVWSDSEPFKRSIVYREEINHMFPIQHSDVLLQTLNYRVPLDKVSVLSRFDGSLIVDRTKGELSARNHRQEMNILAFNLADKIVRGEMTVEKARREYSRNAEMLMSGTTNKMLTELDFKTRGNTSDPDTMMQSQEAGSGSSVQRQPEAQAVDVIIIDERGSQDSSDSMESMEKEEEKKSEEEKSMDSETESLEGTSL